MHRAWSYNLHLYNIEGYISFHTTRIDKYGGGIVLYINSTCKTKKNYHVYTGPAQGGGANRANARGPKFWGAHKLFEIYFFTIY